MRTREEIEEELSSCYGEKYGLHSPEQRDAAFLEVLLDIRDLLTPKGPKTVHPVSPPPPPVVISRKEP
jgi:hypothetical protein